MHRHRQVPQGAHRQSGFIQNFIIPGLILIGVVIAGIAMLSSNTGGNSDNERAAVIANSVMGQGLSVAAAIQRAEADGAIPAATVATTVDITSTGVLVAGRFMAAGAVLPATAGAAAWQYKKVHSLLRANGAVVGTAAADDMLYVPITGAAAESICLRINTRLYGTSALPGTVTGSGDLTTAGATNNGVTGAPTGAAEGCVTDTGNAGAYTYFRAITIR